MEARFGIGTTFIPRGKKNQEMCTVVDILRTYNSKDELVSIEYVATHKFLGQPVKARYVDTTIARGLLEKVEHSVED